MLLFIFIRLFSYSVTCLVSCYLFEMFVYFFLFCLLIRLLPFGSFRISSQSNNIHLKAVSFNFRAVMVVLETCNALI